MILTKFTEGVYTPEQVKHLEHLAQFAPNWFWCARASKAPRDPHKSGGETGSVNDLSTTGTLEQALQAMKDQRGVCVGLLVSVGVPRLVGIDVDNVIHDGDVHPIGLEVMRQFSSAYVEVSPSGTGLRIFCTGTKPDSAPKGSTAIGQEHHGIEIKFEIYASGGAGRYLRVTGLPVESTRGAVAPCQSGIDWFCEVLAASAANKVTSASKAPNSGKSFNIQDALKEIKAAFIELDGLRTPREETELDNAIRSAIAEHSRCKFSKAWEGDLKPFKGDPSTADKALCCEVIRLGASHFEDVVAAWGESALGKRDKFNREDYQVRTVLSAATDVLVELRRKANNGGKPAPAIELPAAVVEALEQTGDVMTRAKSGRIEPTEGNVVMVLRNDPRVAGLLGFNELSQRAERLGSFQVFDRGACTKPGALSDDDVTRASMWLAIAYGVNIDHKCLMRGIEAAALDAKFDPLADSLLALGKQWDGVPRVDSWLTKYALVDDTGCAEYVSVAGRCFMVGAVARALEPGCKVDTVLSVEGAGGGGKSSMFKVLADAVGKALFTDGVHDVSDTTSLIEGAEGCWIIELAELAGIRRAADVEALKKALTQTEDKHRRPYDVLTRVIQRRSVFVATTNRTEGYIADPTGALARRFHPVRTLSTEKNQIDRAGLEAVAGQLWGEAVRMYQAGVKWHIAESDGKSFSQWVNGRELRNEDGAFHSELFTYLQVWYGDDYIEGRSLTKIAEAVGDRRTVEAGGTGAAAMALAGTLVQLGMVKRKSGTSKWFFTVDACNKFEGLKNEALREQAGKGKNPRLRAA